MLSFETTALTGVASHRTKALTPTNFRTWNPLDFGSKPLTKAFTFDALTEANHSTMLLYTLKYTQKRPLFGVSLTPRNLPEGIHGLADTLHTRRNHVDGVHRLVQSHL